MRDCPLCGRPPSGIAFPFATDWGGRRYHYRRCSGCGTTFVDPAPTAAELERFYDQSNYHDEHYGLLDEHSQETRLTDVLGHLRRGGDLLDFGCGNGFFLKEAAAAGFRSVGVELEAKTREWAAANSGCEVLPLDQVEAERRSFDVIHLGDVLEHLPDPSGTMRQLERLLKEDGRFFVEGPLETNPSLVHFALRAYDQLKALRGGRRPGDFPPLHLFRTDATSQRRFFEDLLGYDVHHWRVGEDGWPYWSRKDRLLRPRSASHAARMAIGVLAVGTSRVASSIGLKIGDRFSAVVSPKQVASAGQ